MYRLLTLALLISLSLAAQAQVEVTAVQHARIGQVLAVKVSEDIAPGDYEALIKGLRTHPGKFARKILLLDSIGGSVAEAVRMGRVLREFGFDALVPRDGICQGSCIYLLAAGNQKLVRGPVGLHRPYYPGGDSARDLSPSAGNPLHYLRDMGVAPSLAQDMQQIAPQRMRELSKDDLTRYRLN
ncbi:hypothetical protein D3880_16120 [Pseudomonas cavernae]|uniref:Periplasmic protein-like protein n=1 Tax=Pseudomonas cavernae TaxID=2320867 RepID=A0A385Z6V2_9PSED|nr:hypothetical protein [Pseudomonas cavernae]AYC33787.1 hypothetical protein D3880_16120 [Pseudomonas cavernae]